MAIPRISKEYVHVPIEATGLTGPQIAIMQGANAPSEGHWKTGEWDGSEIKVLVGPGAFELTKGRYGVWVRFTLGAEKPVRLAGYLEVK